MDRAGQWRTTKQKGAADGAEAAPAKKGKLKLIIAVVGFVVILGGGVGAGSS